MQDNSFDKQIQQQLRDVSIEPAGHVWTAVEKELDKKKRRFPFVWWIFPVLLVGIGAAIYFGGSTLKDGSAAKTTLSAKNAKPAGKLGTLEENIPAKGPLQQQTGNAHIATSQEIEATGISLTAQKSAALPIQTNSYQSTTSDGGVVSKRIIKDEAKQKVNIKNTDAENGDETAELSTLSDTTTVKITEAEISSIQNDNEKGKLQPIDSSLKELQKTPPTQEQPSKTIKWQAEWLMAAGVTQVRALSFSGSGAELMYSPGSTGSNPNQGTNTRVRNEYKFNTGVNLAAGWQMKTALSKKLEFVIGLHYNYQSARVDKRVIVDSATSLGSGVSYTTVSTEQFKERLVIHSFHVPLLLRYAPAKKLALSTGISNQILFAGNWNNFSIVLGKRKTYLPVFHLNPSLVLNKVAVGPFLNVGLRKYSGGQSLVNYGVQLRYTPKK